MARFGSTVAFVVGHRKYKAGQTYADTAGNAQAGDVVWIGMSSSTMSPGLVPLDGAATSMKNASMYASTQVPRIDGANSIE